ncbi:MAG TPA: Tol-Pal system beta propeller repeat protein TolB [Syntrophorhabdaceae bacterium]|nr:Tol-Pal system beta propeller repeat protein TolB [Syntrophorhabdaceae bacterium]HPU28837.1 Tol-Pal system beta propeller repeat protein TolB [Syntrophorhabdaceae bacterium]
MKIRQFAFLLLLLFAIVNNAQGKIYLDVYGKSLKKITIAVPYFKGERPNKLNIEMSELLNKDLDLSGFFIPAPQTLFDRELMDEGIEKKDIKFNNWRSIGVELLCKGMVQEKNDEVVLDAYVYDTIDGSLVYANKYRSRSSDWRRLIHRLADDIIYAVTGEKGIMSSRVVFVYGQKGKKEIYAADLDGYNIQKLTNYNSITVSPSISPDGKYIAYTTYAKGRPYLYILDMHSKKEVYVDSDAGMKLGTAWKDKNTFAYASTSGRKSTIYIIDVTTGVKKAIVSGDGIYTSPSFSPDGKKVVYVSDRHGSPHIFMTDISTGETKRLTFFGNYNVSPNFSPKGDLIVFVSKVEGSFEICIMNADGSNPRILTNGGLNDSPRFSFCGRYIIYSTNRGNKNSIAIMLFNGENKKILNFTDGDETQPFFMP